MSSLAHDTDTFPVEVTNISSHGIWLLAHGEELFMSYEDFPWFKDKPIKAIFNVEEPSHGHYFWPDVDVDVTEKIIKNPNEFPLVAKINRFKD